jgi:hypothetical protein
MPNIRVLTFGHYGTLKGTTSVAGIRDRAMTLLCWLEAYREGDSVVSRPIVFVGHSLGGIIIKEVITKASRTRSI